MYLHTHTIPGSRSNELSVLPSPELDTLLHYAKVLSDTKQRDHIDLMVMMLLSNDHVGKLLVIFEQCAQQDDLSNMRTLRGIFSTLLLWADTDMIQELVRDEHIHGVVSVFDFMSKRQPSFREQFETMERLHLIDLLKKSTMLVETIRQLESLTFIKNQIAPQYRQITHLVDSLDRVCVWKHLAIANWMQQDTLILPKLFCMLGNATDGGNDDDSMTIIAQKRSGLQFLSNVVGFALNDMQRFVRASFIRALTSKGLLDVLQQLLCEDDKIIQTTAAHLLYTITQMDLWVLQNHILAQNKKQQQHHPSSGLLHIILDQLVCVKDYALKLQLFGIVQLVLGLADTTSTGSNKQPLSRYNQQSIFDDDPVIGNMLKLFYERYASKLILPIHAIQDIQEPSADHMINDALVSMDMCSQQIAFYTSLCDFLQTILLKYGTQTKRILQDRFCFHKMAQLLRCPDTSLKIQTIGFFLAVIGLRDNDINGLLIQQNVFAYLVRLLLDIHPQQHEHLQQHQQHNNGKQVYKELVELFEFIQRRNIFVLMEHIISRFGEVLEPFPVYQSLKARYDKRTFVSS